MRVVSDEVWLQLDPGAGRLSRRTTRRLWAAFLAALLLYVLGVAVWYSGLLVPQLRWKVNGFQVSEVQPVPRLTANVSNAGLFPVTVVGAGRAAPGFELIGVEGALPATLRPGDTVTVTLVYRIRDCAAIAPAGWSQTAVVARPWGLQSVPIRADQPWAIWQERLGEFSCHR
jgi:hypothetical protein